ncbi:37354_t:CDS:2 [Gigaspora margarita]|uniref:37354_t:CDS:1 n=1 Tax=Gigaspora margarita TaxID=4874 RepID=A0ABN7UEM2_GIGMA|nr:37354_t:CDS:2 [Gigaspora margarita]
MSSKKPKETKTTLTNEQRKAIIKHKEKTPQISQIDLVDWIKQTIDLKVHQIEKVKTFTRSLDIPEGDFKFLSGWLQKFKKRHKLKKITKHGEDASVDEEADKVRLTLALCTNADETDKRMPFVIELYNNIEKLNFQTVMDLEKYINYSEEKIVTGIMSDQEILNQVTYQDPEQAEDNKEDGSIEIPHITHKEALDAINQIELYLLQQDLNDVT